ncbi:MAG: hypothetical protein M1825_003244 [Sarcosagium campestre]|nr:MAG: hypothetical protein M1825_003244 [Sarcosagium campestre]
MLLLNPTFLVGICLLLYLSSFLFLAILRIITGISIQRVGYFSLRRIAYTPRDGIKIEIRRLGLALHRPTFAQRTWLSLEIQEPQVTISLQELAGDQQGDVIANENGSLQPSDGPNCRLDDSDEPKPKITRPSGRAPRRSRLWERLTVVKEKIKRLHRKIGWLRLLDVIVTNAACNIQDVGCVQVGSVTMAVDTRHKTVDRSRLFHHKKPQSSGRRPAEWIFTVRSVLFTPDGAPPLEVVDGFSLNVHGLLYEELDGLRDASIGLKLGRVYIPYDQILTCWTRFNHCRQVYGRSPASEDAPEVSLTAVMEELEAPGSHEDKIMQTLSDSKEFFSSILRGIREVNLAVSYVGLTKLIRSFRPAGKNVYLNMAMTEVGLDMHRLDPRSPAHRMYFSRNDISHEALVAAIGLSLDLDDGEGNPDRLFYVPMATTTVKTTFPSRTMQMSEDKGAEAKNSNILFANMVVTSPSVDLDPKHLPLVLAMLQSKPKNTRPSVAAKRDLVSRLLPKASIKLSVHEPVVRVVLPPVEAGAQKSDDYDLLISSNSSIAVDVESSHSAGGELHYSVVSSLRITSHQFYYQTSSGARHNLLGTETLDLKVQMSATPDVYVVANGSAKTFSVHMIRPEISEGVRQIMKHLRRDAKTKRSTSSRQHNFIRSMPDWLLQFHLEGSDFSAEVAGVDSDISDDTRGVALQLESWTADYTAQRSGSSMPKPSRKRAGSRSVTSDDGFVEITPPKPSLRARDNMTDDRRLAVHIHGLEGFIVESMDTWEHEAFVSLPRYELAFTTSSDAHGRIFHLNSSAKTISINYSLYRSYAISVACTVLRTAFMGPRFEPGTESASYMDTETLSSPVLDDASMVQSPISALETVTVDVRVAALQVKATLPADPPLLLQIYGLDTGHHRWAPPFAKAKLIRLHVEAPKMKGIWARLAGVKNARVDYRDSKRKSGGKIHAEHSLDITTETIRLSVPHQLVLHKVFDNIVNAAKATTQLRHRFTTGTNEYILGKRPEDPKRVPRVTLRSRAVLFELEDGPFEWKLSVIYRVGLTEQKHRMAREQAFEVKAKKLEQADKRGSSAYRTRSAQHGRVSQQRLDPKHNRSRSTGRAEFHQSSTSIGDRGRHMRYDREGVSGLSDAAKISTEEARQKLDEYNAQSWKRRIDFIMRFQRDSMKEKDNVMWGSDELPNGVEDSERILGHPLRPALMSATIFGLHIVMDKPSFPIEDLPKFLHRIGKGMPFETKYSLLIPMNLQIDTGETTVNLRDYPLPLLHIPAPRPEQSSRLSSWLLRTDFVIAEEFRNVESTKSVRVEVVPAGKSSSLPGRGAFAIDVKRTVSPVKMYSDVNMDILTSDATRITWGTSIQPAIQDMMMVIETFTKPQVDPSDRIGFWDKIRLCIHSRVNVAWKGDGDVMLMLKGSRDPYTVVGHGAGFVMCWRNDVLWRLGQDDDPRKFMTVDSGEYVLAIPDYTRQARKTMTSAASRDNESISSVSSDKNGTLFKKVIMKLSGNVQWLAGLMFERDADAGRRSFNFKPHYDVTLKSPEYAKPEGDGVYDAMRGFRSNYIHLSIAVVAPLERDWSVTNLKPSSSYNAVHLTPRFFTHFFDWWSLFSGVMSLPIRQGKLWPGVEKSSKKFGRHLATIKYNLLLSPLFISHVYKHKDAEDYSEDLVSATGLKIRLDSFMLDLHQRREEFATHVKGRKNQTRTSGMRINEVQLDFISADIRAVSASIAGTTAQDLKRASEETIASYQEQAHSVDMSKFTIPDNDFSWIDMDDFVELDWLLPAEANPKTMIMPLAFAPRFTYFRQTDHGDSISGDTTRSSPFGNEPTHFCVMSRDNDPRQIQANLVQERLATLNEQMMEHQRKVGECELDVIRDATENPHFRHRHSVLLEHGHVLNKRRELLETMLRELAPKDGEDDQPRQDAASDSSSKVRDGAGEDVDSTLLADFASDFNNRFIIHNMQMKWNNSLRNIILRYIHQVSQRRGFVYYMTRRAVKFIVDIVDEQARAKRSQEEAKTAKSTKSTKSTPTIPSSSSSPTSEASDSSVEERIRQLLGDDNKSVRAEDSQPHEDGRQSACGAINDDISEEYTAQNSYHVRLIAPQFQMQSEKNAKSAVLVTAKGMELKVVQIMDKDRVLDNVSGLVQRRFSADMDSVQFFVTNQKTFGPESLHMLAGNFYGTPANSTWPPWVPLEVLFEFQLSAYGFARVVKKTSASLRYDKFNTLRIKYNEGVSGHDGSSPASSRENEESRIDHLWVEFPEIRAICDSSQYNAMYLIVLDLLLYNEPLEKIRSEKLEKIMLASDFSDLRGAPEMVTRLQDRIRQLEEIKMQFQINAKYLDRQGWEDRLSIEKDLSICEDELFFMMKAITTAQRKYDDRAQTTGLLRWYLSASEVVWHLIRDKNQPLMEIQLENAAYDRTDNSDGSNHNSMQIERIRGFNLLPNAIYPDMIGPYFGDSKSIPDGRNAKMLRVYWFMLEAIAGIPVMDHFEVNLFPMKIQLEREIGKKLFEYIFPGMGSNAFEGTAGISSLASKVTQSGNFVEDGAGDEAEAAELQREQNAHAHSKSLEMRLRPTHSLPRNRTPVTAPTPTKQTADSGDGHRHFRLFQPPERRRSTSRSRSSRHMSLQSADSLTMTALKTNDRSSTSLASSMPPPPTPNSEAGKKFTLRRSMTKDRDRDRNDDKRSDDLTQMVSRASNYMTLAYVKIPSMVLCLSYKGKGERNIEDVNDFVFRMPILEYRNKTWSNLDLALHLKRDVIKALISHTGAIIGNKLSHHRPKAPQQSRLREMANASSLFTGTSVGTGATSSNNSDTSSLHGYDFDDRSSSPRLSFNSDRTGTLPRTASYASSLRSSAARPSSLYSPEVPAISITTDASDDNHSFIHQTLGRHLTHLSQKARNKEAAAEESDESNRKKSKLLLGKRILGSLN